MREDVGGAEQASHIFFVVRDDDGHSDLLFQTSDTTWQAYNDYGGNSLYVGSPAGRAYKVSYNRPFDARDASTRRASCSTPSTRWCAGSKPTATTSATSPASTRDRRGAELLEHKVFLSVGHDEYWSGQQRANVEAARDAGVHLAFFSGNEVFWKTRWENSIDGTAHAVPHAGLLQGDARRTPRSIRRPTWTGTWRDPRFSPPSDGGRPENALTGTIFMVNGYESRSIDRPAGGRPDAVLAQHRASQRCRCPATR